MSRIGTSLRDQLFHASHLALAAGNHRELRVEAFEVELADDAVQSLLEQKQPRHRLQPLPDQPELALGEPELAVFLRAGIAVRKENLGWGLLDNRAADRAIQHIARTLCRQTEHAI